MRTGCFAGEKDCLKSAGVWPYIHMHTHTQTNLHTYMHLPHQEMHMRTGCFAGDKDCLKSAGVWPGSAQHVATAASLVHDKKSAYRTLARADKILASIMPADPDVSV
jgi:hypothetical protein